ncbi:alpha/beta fold hydrolase [Bordetella sp. BOR01]|uniref:alpha/beta fold hydrolase n=1 Tax=Bordetella sp. BOR01 TaxID=2854779 RepID=UPI001C47962D|nr:alpha/beta fold hydrolase [Bordetella sp. BOR01]
MQLLHDFVELNGGRLCFVRGGLGRPIVLIHGGHGGWAHWARNVEPLSKAAKVIAVDLPGFGCSYDPGRCLTVDEQCAVMGEFLDQQGLSRVTLVGFSFGAVVAAALARTRADRVASLVVVNPPGVGPRSEYALALPARLSALSKTAGFRAGVEGVLRELMLCNHALIDSALIDKAAETISQTRYVTRGLSQGSQMLAMLERVSQDIRVFIGAEDPFHSNDLEGRKAGINGRVGYDAVCIVPRAAHWLQYDRADFFNEALLDFHTKGERLQATLVPIERRVEE